MTGVSHNNLCFRIPFALFTYLAIIIPSKQITHVFLSALDLSGFVYIQMLKLYIATCFGLQIDHLQAFPNT
jgi:hypothetical protein